jgi:hypothetical protein
MAPTLGEAIAVAQRKAFVIVDGAAASHLRRS